MVDNTTGDAGSGGGSFPIDNDSGIQLVGMEVTTCCHTNVPTPKKMHHAHCSNVSLVVEKAILPNSTITICETNVAIVAQQQAEHQKPQSLPQQQQQQQQVSFPHKQQAPGIHVAPGAPIPPHVLQTIPAAAPTTTRISIPEQSSYSHTETAV
jgi:hypothetical protein